MRRPQVPEPCEGKDLMRVSPEMTAARYLKNTIAEVQDRHKDR